MIIQKSKNFALLDFCSCVELYPARTLLPEMKISRLYLSLPYKPGIGIYIGTALTGHF